MSKYGDAWQALRTAKKLTFKCYIADFERVKRGLIKAKVEQKDKTEEEKFLKLVVTSKVKKGNQYEVVMELKPITKTRGGIFI